MISAVENSNEFQKTRFWKEKSVENVVVTILEGLPFNSSMISLHIWLFKKSINIHCKTKCSHVEVPYFVMGSH